MINFFKEYFPYYKFYKKQILLAIFGLLLAAGTTSALAYLIKPVLDDIFVRKDLHELFWLPFLVVTVYVAKSAGTFIKSYYINYIGRDVVRQKRNDLMAHLIKLDVSYFHSFRSGELISRIITDTSRLQSAIAGHVATLTQEVLTIIGLVGVVIYQSPKLALIGLVIIPLAFYPLTLLANRMRKISHKTQEKMSDIAANASEIFNNIELIKASNSDKFEQKRFDEHNAQIFKVEMKGVRTSEAVNPLMEALGAVAAGAVIYIGGQDVINGTLTVGEFFSFLTALFMIYTPIRQISSVHNNFQDALAANSRLHELFGLKPTIVGGNINHIDEIKTLDIKNATLKYGDKVALDNINLTINKGETVALVGSSGAGKSSMIGLMMRLFDVNSGAVFFNNTNIKDLTLEALRAKIAFVSQRIYILNDTVAANVAYGEEFPDLLKVEEALRAAHAYDFVSKLPKQEYTVLGEFGATLSGGQRQRIAIARAIYKNPEILIFDEATAALDNESERAVMSAIEELRENRIVILIAHRMSSIKIAKKIVVLSQGQIACVGSESELLEKCSEFQRLQTDATI